MEKIFADEVKKLFDYNPKTGIVKRKIYRCGRALKGSVVCGKSKKGYLIVGLNGKNYMLHRIIWLYYYGVWPKNQIDHINQRKDDNRIDNLRDVNTAVNCQNRGVAKNNKAGYSGVYFNKANKKWIASTTRFSKRIYFGCYEKKQEAINKIINYKKQYEQREDFSKWPYLQSTSS